MATRSKLSSVSWNAYVRSRLVTADYDGLIQLWDAGAGGAELQQFDEHARRVWSVDFSRADPTRFLSGSDDGTGGWPRGVVWWAGAPAGAAAVRLRL